MKTACGLDESTFAFPSGLSEIRLEVADGLRVWLASVALRYLGDMEQRDLDSVMQELFQDMAREIDNYDDLYFVRIWLLCRVTRIAVRTRIEEEETLRSATGTPRVRQSL